MDAVGEAVAVNRWVEADAQRLGQIEMVCNGFHLPLTDHCILVNITQQMLHLIELGKLVDSYVISSALNGVGQESGSFKTPLGLHSVGVKVGHGMDPFTVFVDRMPTGEIAEPQAGGKKILGRILWLKGADPGFNLGWKQEGPDEPVLVDSYERFIYIHGTDDIAHIGNPVSQGCIRMKPADVVDLFDKVPEGTPVHIYCN